MDNSKSTIYTYGFEPAEIEGWQTSFALNAISLEANMLDSVPADEPIIVYARRAAELTRISEERGLPNDLILYLPAGADIPTGAYYEAVITDSQLPRLKELLAHPQQLRIAQMAESVPLQLLAKPVQSLDLQQLGLPEKDAAHLATCPICPDLLRTALRERVRLYQQVACPTPEELIEYAMGMGTDSNIKKHITECPLCEAQLTALTAALSSNEANSAATQLVDYTQKTIFEVDLANKPTNPAANEGFGVWLDHQRAARRLQAAFGLLYDMLLAVKQGAGGWQVAEAKGTSANVEPEIEVQALLQDAYDTQTPISLNLRGQKLDLGWDDVAITPYLSVPSGASAITEVFSAELRESDSGDLVWSAISSHNRLVMPSADIESAIRDYERRTGQTSDQDRKYRFVILWENI